MFVYTCANVCVCMYVCVMLKLMAFYLSLSCRGLALAAALGLILWLSLDTAQRPEQLVSFAGICVFLVLLFAGSKHHRAVSVPRATQAGSQRMLPVGSGLGLGRDGCSHWENT